MPVCVPFFKNKESQDFLFISFFILGCTGLSLLCQGFLWSWGVGAVLCSSVKASHCEGFSCHGGQTASAVFSGHSTRLQRWSCASSRAWAQELPGRRSLPRPGIETMPLHRQLGSYPLHHQGSPVCVCVYVRTSKEQNSE